jgi:uncharacterized DUF497 family protein
MEFDGFSWDEGNREKCQKHGVSITEVESMFSRRVLIVDDADNSDHERRYRAIGTTNAGRTVFVVFAWRGSLIRPISARYMHRKEIDRYEKDNSDL